MHKLIVAILLVSTVAYAQETDMWQILAEVGYESRPVEQTGFQIDSPKFSKNLWSWNGKRIKIKGYLVPLSETGGVQDYMLSSMPFNQCYFCGGAGPETVVEIQTRQVIKFVTHRIIMEGILVLNDRDPDHHMYIVKDARLIE